MRLFVTLILALSFMTIAKSDDGTCRCPNCSDGCCKGTCSGGAGSAQATQAPQQQQTTTPASSGSNKGSDDDSNGKKSKGCFSGDETVVTNFGTLKMSELVGKKDIKVLTHNAKTDNLEMSPITYWIHAVPAKKYKFLTLSTESGHKLHLTRFHLIYETNCAGLSRTIFANNVQIGNCLQVQNENGKLTESKVVAIEEVEKVGLYAPITENDNIVVNDVLASCYTDNEDIAGQKLMFSFMIWAKNSLELVVPKYFLEAFYSTPFASVVDVPKFMFSFFDLSKVFLR